MTATDRPTAPTPDDRVVHATAESAESPALPAHATDLRPVSAAVPRSVQVTAAWSWRMLVIAAATAVTIWLIAVLKTIVVPVALALLLTVLLAPFVGWLQRRVRLPRGGAAAVGLLGVIAFVLGLLTLAGSSIVAGMSDLREEAAAGFEQVLEWLATGPLQLSEAQLQDYLDRVSGALGNESGTLVTGALSLTVTVGHIIAGALIALFCTFFFLLDGRRIWSWVVGLLPRPAREPVHQAARRGYVTLGAYTRTQILVALIDATGIGVGAAILQVPLALPLAVLVFVGAFIPIVGAVLSGAVAVLVALVAQGPVVALLMLGVVLLVQQIEGHVLQPLLMGHAVSLHPVAVILVVAAGSLVAGIVGALLAVPIAAVINTVVLYLHGHDKFPQLGDEDHVAERPPGRRHPVLDRAIAEVQPATTASERTTASVDARSADAGEGRP